MLVSVRVRSSIASTEASARLRGWYLGPLHRVDRLDTRSVVSGIARWLILLLDPTLFSFSSFFPPLLCGECGVWVILKKRLAAGESSPKYLGTEVGLAWYMVLARYDAIGTMLEEACGLFGTKGELDSVSLTP